MTTVEGKAMEKTKDQYTNSYFMKFSKKLQAMNILHCGLDPKTYNRICSFEAAK